MLQHKCWSSRYLTLKDLWGPLPCHFDAWNIDRTCFISPDVVVEVGVGGEMCFYSMSVDVLLGKTAAMQRFIREAGRLIAWGGFFSPLCAFEMCWNWCIRFALDLAWPGDGVASGANHSLIVWGECGQRDVWRVSSDWHALFYSSPCSPLWHTLLDNSWWKAALMGNHPSFKSTFFSPLPYYSEDHPSFKSTFFFPLFLTILRITPLLSPLFFPSAVLLWGQPLF